MNEVVFAGKHFLTFNVSRHKHNTWELVYCTGSCGRFVFDQSELGYQEGDIVIIPPGMPHENLSEGGFTNIHLNIAEATLPFQQPVVVHDDANRSILHLFSDTYYHFCGDPERRAALLPGYGTLIVRCMTAANQHSPRNRLVEKIEQSIVQNYANAHYELDEILSTMPYCADHLCKLFRAEMGVTPHKYLNNLRLQAAADMLRSTHSDQSISEIAHLCGFINPLYFSRMFKKRYGVSPREYCRQSQSENPAADSDSQKIIL